MTNKSSRSFLNFLTRTQRQITKDRGLERSASRRTDVRESPSNELKSGDTFLTTTTKPPVNTDALSRAVKNLERLVEPYSAPPAMNDYEQKVAVKQLKNGWKSLLTRTEEPISSHFDGLISGLNTIQDAGQSSESAVLIMTDAERAAFLSNKNEKELLRTFDVLYYHGKLTFKMARHILRARAVKNVQSIYRRVSLPGSLLKWTNTERHAFTLQLANKFYNLGQVAEAANLVTGNFDSMWVPLIRSMELDSSTYIGLARALLAMDGRKDLKAEIAAWDGNLFRVPADSVLCGLYLPFWVAASQSKDLILAQEISDSALHYSSLHTRSSQTPHLYFEILSLIYKHLTPELIAFFKDHPLHHMFKLDIDLNRVYDWPAINQMLEFNQKLEKAGFLEVSTLVRDYLQVELRDALMSGESYDMISRALVSQRLSTSRPSSSSLVHDSPNSFVPVHF